MVLEESIAATIDANIDINKVFDEVVIPGLKKMNQKTTGVEFHPLYKKSVEQAKNLKPHVEGDYFPSELFKKLSPHQRDDEFKWMQHNYEPFTLPVFVDFMNTIKRGVNRRNYSVTFNEGDGEFKEYCEEGIPGYQSIHTWMQSVLFDYKIKDANGVFAVRPKAMYFADGADGAILYRDDVTLDPIPVFYESHQVVRYVENDHLFAISNEKTKIKHGSTTVDGFVLYLYTQTAIWKFDQVGKQNDYQFTAIKWMQHNYEDLPAWQAKGMPRVIGVEVYYQSPYYFALAALNTMLKNSMVLEMANVNVAYPYRIMMAEDCDNIGSDGEVCLNGTIAGPQGETITCPACHGSGKKDKPSAGGTLMVTEQRGENTNLDRIRFVAPDTSILDWMIKKVKLEEIRARQLLHLKTTIDEATNADDTATGRLLDMSSTYAFMMPILEEGFDIFENIIKAMRWMRDGKKGDIKVVRPVDIDYKTTYDYLEEYKMAAQGGAPAIVLNRLLENYIKSLFYGTDKEEKAWKVVLVSDGLAAYSNEEVRSLLASKMVEPWQAILHINIQNYLKSVDADKFFEKDIQAQKEELIAMAKTAAESMKLDVNRLIDNLAYAQ